MCTTHPSTLARENLFKKTKLLQVFLKMLKICLYYNLKIQTEVLCNMGIIFNCLHYFQSSNYHFEITINTLKIIYFKLRKY
ncbi:hypothetical protein Nmel_003936 [Mimus melanotis]